MEKSRNFFDSLLRVILVLAIFLFAGVAQGEWNLLGRTDSFRVYIDQKPIQKNGEFAQIWQIMDFTSAQWVDAQTVVGSIKNLIEYDCKQARFRTLAVEAYSEQMSDGRLVANEQIANPQWETVEPGGTAEKSRQFACGN